MPIRRLAAALAALSLGLAVPAVALAQGAGDEQYQDPFGSQQTDTTPQTTTPAVPAQSEPEATAPSAPAPPADVADPQLPRTGGAPGLVAVAGVGLILAGVGLRLRVTGD